VPSSFLLLTIHFPFFVFFPLPSLPSTRSPYRINEEENARSSLCPFPSFFPPFLPLAIHPTSFSPPFLPPIQKRWIRLIMVVRERAFFFLFLFLSSCSFFPNPFSFPPLLFPLSFPGRKKERLPALPLSLPFSSPLPLPHPPLSFISLPLFSPTRRKI